jgi:hypothetical protein
MQMKVGFRCEKGRRFASIYAKRKREEKRDR